jgi:small subunit ribosomal protein S2
MKPYIYGRRNQIHIIDLRQTVRGLLRATHFLAGLTATGAQILFVGTKRQIKQVIEDQSKRCSMPYVSERWIGGSLTNFAVIKPRLEKLKELEASETDGTLDKMPKKEISKYRRVRRKLTRNLDGIRTLEGLPGAVVVIDPRREEIAMREAHRMGIPTICILDTDCDPELADIVIPANDDAMKSVELLIAKLADAVLEGRANYAATAMIADKQKAADQSDEPRPRASRRPGSDRGPRSAGGERGGAERADRGRRGGRGGRPGGRTQGSRSDGLGAEHATGSETPEKAGETEAAKPE